ncbi:MAG TPA: protein translocase subunit SecD [Clostridiaceae bacterium]|nr:protein translocase subunit SecD [Clostridiaceae bacterium]
MNRYKWARFSAVIVVIAVLTYLVFCGLPALGISNINDMRLGIDIKGGVYANLYPDLPDGQKPTADQLEAARTVIERRLDNKGIFDRNISIEPENGRVIVEIPYAPGEEDLSPQKAIEEIGKTARLTFQEVDEEKYDGYLENGSKNYLPTGKIVIEGKHVVDAGVATDPDSGSIVVTLKLNEEGAQKFAEATERLIYKPIAIFMDDELIVAPTVQNKITNGEAIITGQRDAKEAGELAATIEAGALPFKLVSKDLNSITPILGEGALKVTINAGIVAFILISLFMILNYRLPGLIASVALFGLVVAQLAVLTWFRISLTLPGIAGIILSIGMGVDANVIIFERIKEEIASGKTIGAAIDVGFKRAFAAILDSNVTTLITGVILWRLGTGPIKGFAVTLCAGVLISFLTAVTATKAMLDAIAITGAGKKPWLYGVKGVAK